METGKIGNETRDFSTHCHPLHQRRGSLGKPSIKSELILQPNLFELAPLLDLAQCDLDHGKPVRPWLPSLHTGAQIRSHAKPGLTDLARVLCDADRVYVCGWDYRQQRQLF
jgi:hypothetical protein